MSRSNALFVARNAYSLAEAGCEWQTIQMGIHADDELVGYVMFGLLSGEMWVWWLMVDGRYQRRSYGRAAMRAIVATARAWGHEQLFVSYDPENDVAAALYGPLGFEPPGRAEDGETVVCLALSG